MDNDDSADVTSVVPTPLADSQESQVATVLNLTGSRTKSWATR